MRAVLDQMGKSRMLNIEIYNTNVHIAVPNQVLSSPGDTPLSRYRKRAHFGKISYRFILKFYTNLQSPVARLKLSP